MGEVAAVLVGRASAPHRGFALAEMLFTDEERVAQTVGDITEAVANLPTSITRRIVWTTAVFNLTNADRTLDAIHVIVVARIPVIPPAVLGVRIIRHVAINCDDRIIRQRTASIECGRVVVANSGATATSRAKKPADASDGILFRCRSADPSSPCRSCRCPSYRPQALCRHCRRCRDSTCSSLRRTARSDQRPSFGPSRSSAEECRCGCRGNCESRDQSA